MFISFFSPTEKKTTPFLSLSIGHGVCIYKFIFSGHLNEVWLWYGLAKKLDTAHKHTCQNLDLWGPSDLVRIEFEWKPGLYILDRNAVTLTSEESRLRRITLSGHPSWNVRGFSALTSARKTSPFQLKERELRVHAWVSRLDSGLLSFVLRFVCEGTVEEKILQLQEKKKDLAKQVLSGSGASVTKLTLADLKILFGI